MVTVVVWQKAGGPWQLTTAHQWWAHSCGRVHWKKKNNNWILITNLQRISFILQKRPTIQQSLTNTDTDKDMIGNWSCDQVWILTLFRPCLPMLHSPMTSRLDTSLSCPKLLPQHFCNKFYTLMYLPITCVLSVATGWASLNQGCGPGAMLPLMSRLPASGIICQSSSDCKTLL